MRSSSSDGDIPRRAATIASPAILGLLELQRKVGNCAVQNALKDSGGVLESTMRRSLDRQVAGEFPAIRIHADSSADELSRALGARAFTVGQHIFFRAGEYSPDTEAGQRLIRHEAAHVVQQQNGVVGGWSAPSGRHESAATAFEAGGPLTAAAGRAPAVQRQADDGSQADTEMPLPMARLTFAGDPTEVDVEGGCDGLSLHGQANATFDGGRANVAGQKVTRSTSCSDCGDQPCLHLTGTLVTKYSVSVAITMPPMPDGLTSCERGKVRQFLTNVLLPHEKDHKQRFKTYNGTTRNPIDITGCGQGDLQSQITTMVTNEDAQRQASANALSNAIDPFVATIDCSSCDS